MEINNEKDYSIKLDLGVSIYFNSRDKRLLISHAGKEIEISETSYTKWMYKGTSDVKGSNSE